MELLANQPGLNKSQIARELDRQLNTIRHHLNRLEVVDLIEMRDSPRGREVVCFLPSQLHLWQEPKTRILFGGSRVTEVARHVVDAPGSTTREIGEALGLSRGGVHRHLTTLREASLVFRFRIGAAYRYYPQSELQEWSESVEESLPSP